MKELFIFIAGMIILGAGIAMVFAGIEVEFGKYLILIVVSVAFGISMPSIPTLLARINYRLRRR